VSPLCAQKLARLQTGGAERAAWADQLAQVKRLHGWLLEVEHLLDESLVPKGEVVSKLMVGSRLDSWRERMSTYLTDGSLSQLERECTSRVLTSAFQLATAPGAVLRPQGLSTHPQRQAAQYSRPQDAVSPREWAQERERVSVAVWALCSLCRPA
jgi:hypothetical protein